MTPRALLNDDRGVVALALALLLPVAIGAGAFAVDMGHYRLVRNRLQSAADAGALAAAQQLDDQPEAVLAGVEFSQLNAPEGFGEITLAEDVTFGAYDSATGSFTPSAVNVNAVRVVARREPGRGNAAPRFLSAILGAEPVPINASAIAARTILSTYGPPELSNLAPEAGDYNEVYAYCFDAAGAGPAEARRSQMTLIARNITPPVAFVWPTCALGEAISFRLRNIRNGRSNPALITSPDRVEYNFHSDTVVVDGREEFAFGVSILETVRCDTLEECRPTSQGGVVPFGRNRTPLRESRPCVPGKFMYYGWEDRPPGLGWTDQDYDDIVFVMRCPAGLNVAFGASRLVR